MTEVTKICASYVVVVTVLRALFVGWPAISQYKRALAEHVSEAQLQQAPAELKLSARQQFFDALFQGGTGLSPYWSSLHEHERRVAPRSAEALSARALKADSELARFKDATATVLRKALKPASEATAEEVRIAQEYLHFRNDTAYERAGRTHRMAFFVMLLLAAALPIVSVWLATAVVLAFGALGGILSRGMKVVTNGATNGSDNGLQWSGLLVGPLLGAACAVAGLFLVSGLEIAGIAGGIFDDVCVEVGFDADQCEPLEASETGSAGQLRASFGRGAASSSNAEHGDRDGDGDGCEDCDDPAFDGLGPVTMLLAFMFGFSERLFLRWVDSAEASFAPKGAPDETVTG